MNLVQQVIQGVFGKDAADRERGLKRLEKRFLTMSGDATEALERIRQALEAQGAGRD